MIAIFWIRVQAIYILGLARNQFCKLFVRLSIFMSHFGIRLFVHPQPISHTNNILRGRFYRFHLDVYFFCRPRFLRPLIGAALVEFDRRAIRHFFVFLIFRLALCGAELFRRLSCLPVCCRCCRPFFLRPAKCRIARRFRSAGGITATAGSHQEFPAVRRQNVTATRFIIRIVHSSIFVLWTTPKTSHPFFSSYSLPKLLSTPLKSHGISKFWFFRQCDKKSRPATHGRTALFLGIQCFFVLVTALVVVFVGRGGLTAGERFGFLVRAVVAAGSTEGQHLAQFFLNGVASVTARTSA